MEASLKANLESNLKALKLPTMLANYSECARVSASENYTYEHFLLSLAEKELEKRRANRIQYLLKKAKFPKTKLLNEFDFKRTEIGKEPIIQLCHGHFLAEAYNVIFYGQSGIGKTHLAMAIGRELCFNGFKVIFFTGCELIQNLVRAKDNLRLSDYFKKLHSYDLVIIDELGYIPFQKSEGDLLFQFISDRYERKSLMITTNLSFSEWDVMFSDKMVATAAIDRLVHYSHIFKFVDPQKESYRTEVARKRTKNAGEKASEVTD